MSSLDGISPLTAPALRPELDRAELPPSRLSEFYTLQEQRMITPIAYRDMDMRAQAADPLLYEGATPRIRTEAAEAPDRPAADRRFSAAVEPAEDPPRAGQPFEPLLAEDASSSTGRSPRSPSTTAADPTGPPAPQTGPLPYGADPARIRQLVDGIVEGHAIVPLAYQVRQAGDLLPVKPPSATPQTAAALRPVPAVYRPF